MGDAADVDVMIFGWMGERRKKEKHATDEEETTGLGLFRC